MIRKLVSGIKHSLYILLLIALPSAVATGAAVPAGTRLEVRLRQPLASYSSKAGQPVSADLIAPVRLGDYSVLPQGSVLHGTLTEVTAIGWGTRHLRASIRLEFRTLHLPDGTSIPLDARVAAIDNSREEVDETGKIVGIRANSVAGHRLAGFARNVFIWNPLMQLVVAGTTAAVFRFPESEIFFPAGTELVLALNRALEIDTTWTTPLPRLTIDPDQRVALTNLVRQMSFRTARASNGKPGDYVNVIFLGEPEWIERGFSAAGWLQADPLNRKTGWTCYRAIIQSQPYPAFPMISMTLDERPALFQFSKALNTYARRHHLRVFNQPGSWNSRPVLAASSTQDLDVTFAFHNAHMVHVIDRNIDNERAKIVNDLAYTGCVEAAELIPRPWVPAETRNSTGSVLRTDGAVAVLELNPCRSPRRSPEPTESLQVTGGAFQHISRQVLLTLANDFTVNNPVFQLVKAAQFLRHRMSGHERPAEPVRAGILDRPALTSDFRAPPPPASTDPD